MNTFFNKKLFYKLFCFLSLCFLFAGCDTKKVPLKGDRFSVFDDNTKSIKFDKTQIILEKPYINEMWASNSGNSKNNMGHIAGKKNFYKAFVNDIGVKTSSSQILYTPVAKDDVVFTIDGKLKIKATSLKDGKTLWENQRLISKDYLRYGALALDNERLYAITSNGQLVAINPSNGEIIYSKYFNTSLKSGLQICDDKLYFTNDMGEFFVINAKDGEKLYTHKTMEEINSFVKGSNPMCINNNLVIGFSNGEVHMLMRDNNTPIWLESLGKFDSKNLNNMTDIVANPISDGKVVILKSYNNVMKAFDLVNGTMLWELPIGGITTPIISNNVLFDIDNNNIVNAINIENGNLLWTRKIDINEKNVISFDPILINNQLIITLSNGEIIKINPYTGKIIKREKLTSVIDTSPIVIKDMFIILSNADLIIYK